MAASAVISPSRLPSIVQPLYSSSFFPSSSPITPSTFLLSSCAAVVYPAPSIPVHLPPLPLCLDVMPTSGASKTWLLPSAPGVDGLAARRQTRLLRSFFTASVGRTFASFLYQFVFGLPIPRQPNYPQVIFNSKQKMDCTTVWTTKTTTTTKIRILSSSALLEWITECTIVWFSVCLLFFSLLIDLFDLFGFLHEAVVSLAFTHSPNAFLRFLLFLLVSPFPCLLYRCCCITLVLLFVVTELKCKTIKYVTQSMYISISS